MLVTLSIISGLIWLIAISSLWYSRIYAPALSYIALLIISFAKINGYPVIPLSNNMLWSWLAMTVIVMMTVILQDSSTRKENAGIGYLIIGGILGMILGLLCFSISTQSIQTYAFMILGTIVGIIFGALFFSNTPTGKYITQEKGRFIKLTLSKGFPIAITLMQLGLTLALILIIYAN